MVKTICRWKTWQIQDLRIACLRLLSSGEQLSLWKIKITSLLIKQQSHESGNLYLNVKWILTFLKWIVSKMLKYLKVLSLLITIHHRQSRRLINFLIRVQLVVERLKPNEIRRKKKLNYQKLLVRCLRLQNQLEHLSLKKNLLNLINQHHLRIISQKKKRLCGKIKHGMMRLLTQMKFKYLNLDINHLMIKVQSHGPHSQIKNKKKRIKILISFGLIIKRFVRKININLTLRLRT